MDVCYLDNGVKKKRCELATFEYQGNFMGECYVVATVKSAVPIPFEVGDFIEYRGEEFTLNYKPAAAKKSRKSSSGEAFTYENVKFNSLADELTRCDFIDVVPDDNNVHFTLLPNFSFFASTVEQLAERIQANLDRVYTGDKKWTVEVAEDAEGNTDVNVTVDNVKCWDALLLSHSKFGLNFIIRGRKVTIGTAGMSVGKTFGYGMGKGLRDVKQSTNSDALLVTRLKVYGSTRNLPDRYYNKLKGSDGQAIIPESMYVKNLMLPSFRETGEVAYIDSENMAKYGVREHSVYFDGSEDGLPEIFPSMEGMTAEDLAEAGITVDAEGALDVVVEAEQISDDGVIPEGGELEKTTFTVKLKDIGFNPVDEEHLTSDTPALSMKSGMCNGREFEIVACVKSGNHYVLTCNREEDGDLDLVFPYNGYNIEAGDKFVLTGVAMDDIYIVAAEQRLEEAGEAYLAKNDKTRFIYEPTIDDVFMARNPGFHDSIKEGDILDFQDTDFGIDESVIIQSLTIKEGGEIPKYSITLFNDKIESTVEKIQNSITSIANNVGITAAQAKSLFWTWIETWRPQWMDQKLHTYQNVKFRSVKSDIDNWSVDELGNIVGKLVTLTGMQTDNFAAGMTGTGVGIVNKAEVHADKVLVRKYLEVLALLVAQMFYRGGRQVLSPAGMKVSKVVEGDGYYRLYMETDEGQVNEFTVGAQARVNRYGAQTRYWWRLVTGIGTDYIDVSKTDMDGGSAVPSVGDEVVQFGHRTDPYLQWVVMDSSFSDDAGTTIYAGVDSYDLSGKMVLRLGVDPQDPGRIGLFLRNGSEISEEITRIDTEIGSVSEVTDGLNEELTETRNTLNNLIQQTIPDLQNQIDGAIQSWDGSEEPTLENYPANEWTTDTEKARHVGDTYYQNTGDGLYTWKFVKNDDGTYGWQKVADSDTAALEQDIRELAGIVGTKNSIHYTDNVPTPPYIINDIWIKTDGTMYTCIAQRDEGQVGGVADWEVFNDTMIRLAAMASDSVISKEEKAVLRDTWAQVQKEYATYQSQAGTYGVDITGLTNAYNSLSSYLTGTVKINDNTDTSLSVSQKSDYNTRWANWNSETTEFANAVAEKVADDAVDGVQIGGRNLAVGSSTGIGWLYAVFNKEDNSFSRTSSSEIESYIYSPYYSLKAGNHIILSFDAKQTGEMKRSPDLYILPDNYNKEGFAMNVKIYEHTEEWAHYVFESDIPETVVSPCRIRFDHNGTSDGEPVTIYVKNIKLEYGTKATDWTPAPEDVQDEIDAAKEAAQAAQEAAEAAQSDANDAHEELNKIVSDSVISPVEKTALKQQQADMQSEYNEIIANANRYGVGTTAYTAAYNSANAALTKYTAASPEYINIGSDYNNIAAYYPQRQSVLNSIAAAAKQAAQDAADAAKDEANGYTDEAVGGIDIGIVNLLKESDVELGAEGYELGRMYYTESPVPSETYTLVLCYTLGSNNTGIAAFESRSTNLFVPQFTTKGARVVEAKTAEWDVADASLMGFYQFPQGTYGSKVHWAVLVKGNKAPRYWFPSPGDSKMGVENLVSRKLLLSMPGKGGGGIANWGQDSDGVYIDMMPVNDTVLFDDFKANTQYVLSAEVKGNPNGSYYWQPTLVVHYTDGTTGVFYNINDSVYKRVDMVTDKGKTVDFIDWSTANYGANYSMRFYKLSLIEGNVVPLEIPTSSEDEWRSEVNLVDGGKEVTVPVVTSGNYNYKTLVVPSLKPNTVYTVSVDKIDVLAGSPSGFTVSLYSKGVSTKYAEVVLSLESKSGLLITPNNFTAGEARLLLYSGKYSATAGNSVKYTGISLVEGFYPPQGWTPSAGDTRAEIEATGTETKDSFAQKLGYESYADMKNSLSQGMITNTGMLNAKLIETDALVVTDAFVTNITSKDVFANAVRGITFDFQKGKVGGFTIADNKLYAGADFGSGAGVYMQSLANNYGFRAYKDASNYVEMFYRTASDWGLKGLAGGSTVFQLGSTNKIGPFVFDGSELQAVNGENEFSINASRILFTGDEGQIAMGGAGTFATNAVLFINGGDFWQQNGTFLAAYIRARGTLTIEDDLYFKSGSTERNDVAYQSYSNGMTIPVTGRRMIYVSGNSGSDNPCYLAAGVNGQVLTIINTNSSHRLNVKGTGNRDCWIREGEACTFYYFSGKWHAERFDW